MAIELRVLQFWSEIKCEITRMILDQISLHSVQLPLVIDFYMGFAANLSGQLFLSGFWRQSWRKITLMARLAEVLL